MQLAQILLSKPSKRLNLHNKELLLNPATSSEECFLAYYIYFFIVTCLYSSLNVKLKPARRK